MLKRNSLFLCCLLACGIWTITAAASDVDVIRAEDEALLEGVIIEDVAENDPVEYLPQSNHSKMRERRPETIEGERHEKFDPTLLPTNQRETEQNIVDNKANVRAAINACLDSRKEQLYLERRMFDSGRTESVAYLSEIMAEINQCYEEIGYDIIARYYNNDRIKVKAFANKVDSFYIQGTDVNFSPKFCGDNCSMAGILDAQMQKFAEFRIYLYQLLDNGIGG